MLNTDANSLQTLITKLVNKKINAATSYVKRMVMSTDSSGNPAELFGRDGKIYYRSAGGDAAELGGGGQWIMDGTDVKLNPAATGVNLDGHELKATGTNDLILEVPTGQSIIIRKV